MSNKCEICGASIGEYNLVCKECSKNKAIAQTEDIANILSLEDSYRVDLKTNNAIQSILNIANRMGV